jgi:hypothetical protein
MTKVAVLIKDPAKHYEGLRSSLGMLLYNTPKCRNYKKQRQIPGVLKYPKPFQGRMKIGHYGGSPASPLLMHSRPKGLRPANPYPVKIGEPLRGNFHPSLSYLHMPFFTAHFMPSQSP